MDARQAADAIRDKIIRDAEGLAWRDRDFLDEIAREVGLGHSGDAVRVHLLTLLHLEGIPTGQEYPKAVGGVMVHSAEEEAALSPKTDEPAAADSDPGVEGTNSDH